MKERLPLSALLSQTMVAFIVEFDNEFERRTPHRTTNHGATGDPRRVPWLASMAIWFRLLRFVPPDGEISLTELKRATGYNAAQFKQWLTRAGKWWRYVNVQPDGTVLPTPGGAKALSVWNDLNEVIEARWSERFGGEIERIRVALQVILDNNDVALLDVVTSPLDIVSDDKSIRTLPVLLGDVLSLFNKEYVEQAHIPLAMSANLLRVVSEQGTPVRDLPKLTGVAKEALAVMAKAAEKLSYVTSASENRVRMLRRTAAGSSINQRYRFVTNEIERRWQRRFDNDVVGSLRTSLEALAPRLPLALKGYPEGWRATQPACEVLPHYPMISHRGGFPDGS